ncbi:hypothetical protein AQ490_02280 [Wenjunlia vitaminophila]|uniref:Uncharacterized protein n=1 Tax=Wenjunlia vitaminophila TaxID=76728 RepID=A0A0T6LZ95_WENVI|nr:hypothetical protein [Wenjunlia vitaminophila]KRV51055.1 hypothetical protein AQ490_02280 [Wenjunlia vitaminophila]
MTPEKDWDRLLNPFRYDEDGNLTRAAREQDTRMRLNSIDGKRPTGPKLHLSPAELRAVGRAAEKVKSDFEEADDAAEKATRRIASGLGGWRSADAFAEFQERWKVQVAHVSRMLKHNIASPLKNTALDHEAHDTEQSSQFGQRTQGN